MKKSYNSPYVTSYAYVRKIYANFPPLYIISEFVFMDFLGGSRVTYCFIKDQFWLVVLFRKPHSLLFYFFISASLFFPSIHFFHSSLRHVEYLKIRIPPLENSIKPFQYSSANWRKYKIDRPNNMRSSARVSLLLSSKLFFVVYYFSYFL